MKEQNKVLIVVAHPDDETLGAGGTIVKHKLFGDDVHILTLGKGRGNMLDQKFDTLPLLNFIYKISLKIREIEPQIIYTHCHSDLNRDHRIVHEACLVATRPPTPVRELYTFDITSDWAFGSFGSFQPNVFVEIDINKKIELLQQYKEEIRSYPHPRSIKAIKALAMHRGSQSGLRMAEAFELTRWIK